MSNSAPLRFGLVGHAFGRFLAHTIVDLPDARLVAVADRRDKGLDDAAAHYGFTAYRDAMAMMESEQLDALVLAISPKHRKPLMEAAIARGVAMFIEKPWATNREHARELAAMCRASDAPPVMVGFSFRYHPTIVRLKAMLGSELGQPTMLAGRYAFHFHPGDDAWLWDPEDGNGLFNENSCHLFDAVCYLMGRPVRLYAEAETFFGKPSENAATITLRFESGAIAALTVGGVAARGANDFPRIDLFTERGQAQLIGQGHIWTGLNWIRNEDATLRQLPADPEVLGSTRYTHAMNHFIECIREGKQPSAPVDDGVLSVDIAMAVTESARSHKPVDL